MAKVYGFKEKATAERLRDHAHKLKSQEHIAYPEPTRALELYAYTLTTALSGGAGAQANADVELVQNVLGDTENVVVTDYLGLFAPLASGTVGYCYRQGGLYTIIQAGCQQETP